MTLEEVTDLAAWADAGANDGRAVAQRWWVLLMGGDENPIHPQQLGELDSVGCLELVLPIADVDEDAPRAARDAYTDAFSEALVYQVRGYIAESWTR